MENGLTDYVMNFWAGWSGVFGWAGPLKEPLAILFFLSFLASFLGWLGKLGAPPKVLDVANVRKVNRERILRENPGITNEDLEARLERDVRSVKKHFKDQGYVIPAEVEE